MLQFGIMTMRGHDIINVHGGMLCLKLRDGLEIIRERRVREMKERIIRQLSRRIYVVMIAK
jgi:hypothetical protein